MKTLNRSLLAGLAAATLILTGCSNDSTPPETDPTPTASSTPTASTTSDPTDTASPTETNVPVPTVTADPATGQYEWCDPAKQEPFTGGAADEFGAENVMEAYCAMVDLQMENLFIDSLLRKGDGFAPRDFEVVRESLAQSARDDWDADVAKVIADTATEQERDDVASLVAFNLTNGSGYTLDAPAVYNAHFSPARTLVDNSTGTPRLALTFTVGADFALLRDSDQKEMAYSREHDITFTLVPGNPEGKGKAWYIDGWGYSSTIVPPAARDKIIEPSA